MTEQDYKHQIEQAYAEKNWSDVILHAEALIGLVCDEIIKELNVSDRNMIPKETVYAYFAAHDLAPILKMKGQAALEVGDPVLAERMLADAAAVEHIHEK